MVLVDTSVWIRSLAGKEPYRASLDRLLADESVLGHELVYGELLIGDPGARSATLTHYRRFSYAASVAHEEVVALVRARRLFGRGIGWIDAQLLASMLVAGARLYTADTSLAAIARDLGVAVLALATTRSGFVASSTILPTASLTAMARPIETGDEVTSSPPIWVSPT